MDFKRAHLEVDVTTIHPSYIYGLYGLIPGTPCRPVSRYNHGFPPPLHVDVHDVARAHVQDSADEPKQFIFSSSKFTWNEAIDQ